MSTILFGEKDSLGVGLVRALIVYDMLGNEPLLLGSKQLIIIIGALA